MFVSKTVPNCTIADNSVYSIAPKSVYTYPPLPSHRREDLPLCITLEHQGELFRVKHETPIMMSSKPPAGKRSEITHMSDKSRKRLIDLFARFDKRKMKFSGQRVKFITLTYKHNMQDYERAKRDVKVFAERLQERHHTLWLVWRMELQKRGAIHFHLLVGNMPYVAYSDIQRWWYEVTEDNPNPEATRDDMPFTDIQAIKSYRGVMHYAAKYMGKPASSTVSTVTSDGMPCNNGFSSSDATPTNSIPARAKPATASLPLHLLCNVDSAHYVNQQWLASLRDATGGANDGKPSLSLSVCHIFSEPIQADETVTGRWWGVYGRKYLPLGKRRIETFVVPRALVNAYVSELRGVLPDDKSRYLSSEQGFTLYGSEAYGTFCYERFKVWRYENRDVCSVASRRYRWSNRIAIDRERKRWRNMAIASLRAARWRPLRGVGGVKLNVKVITTNP